MENVSAVRIEDIVDALNEGLYVCDLDRRITYWSRSAERITGWKADDVVGRRCLDNVLCHVDQDGHRLCGEEYCPLHRAMVTGRHSDGALLVYALSASGERVPVEVSVAPLRNASGRVIGGVETFRDASGVVHDLERARSIQRQALEHGLVDEDRVSFRTHYIPHDIVGGDYYAIERLDESRYGLMLADVMGHGIAAALYTMHLSRLWSQHKALLRDPLQFTGTLNNELATALQSDAAFATAICAVIDVEKRTVRFASAGGPPVILWHADGSCQRLSSPGFPLALLPDAEYDLVSAALHPEDRLLLFSDGALEISNAEGGMLGMDGLVAMLRQHGYPHEDIRLEALEESLLRFSNAIRLPDDLTLIEVIFHRS